MASTEELELLISARVANLGQIAALEGQMKALGAQADSLNARALKGGGFAVSGTVGAGSVAEAEKLAAAYESAGIKVSGFKTAATEGSLKFEEAMHHAAVTTGLAGEHVENLSRKLGGLQGLMGGGLGMGVAALGVTAGIGIGIEGAKQGIDNAERQAKATEGLRQAAEASGMSFDRLNRATNDYLRTNREVIPNQYDAIDAMALFVRAGNDEKTTTEAMGVALNLSALKHIDLKEAARMVELALMGNGRAVRELGIDLKSLSKDQDITEEATKNLEVAQKTAETASQRLTTAQRLLKNEEDALHGKRVISQVDMDRLKEKQDNVAKAEVDARAAKESLTKATDALGMSHSKALGVLDELKSKTDGGTNTITENERATNRLNSAWQSYTGHLGERALPILRDVSNKAADFVTVLDNNRNAIGNALGTLQHYTLGLDGAAQSIGKIIDGLKWLDDHKSHDVNVNVRQNSYGPMGVAQDNYNMVNGLVGN